MTHKYPLAEFSTRYDRQDHEIHEVLAAFPGYFIAGGAVRALLTGSPITTDVDVFFRNQGERDEFIRVYVPEEKLGTKLHTTFKYKEWKIQAIYLDYYADMDTLLNTFDYTICMCGIDGGNLYVGEYTLWDLARKKLVVNKITYGAASLRRMLKYAKQGYTICQGTATELLKQVSDNPETIRGDIAYVD